MGRVKILRILAMTVVVPCARYAWYPSKASEDTDAWLTADAHIISECEHVNGPGAHRRKSPKTSGLQTLIRFRGNCGCKCGP
jgi:hypothetical protein